MLSRFIPTLVAIFMCVSGPALGAQEGAHAVSTAEGAVIWRGLSARMSPEQAVAALGGQNIRARIVTDRRSGARTVDVRDRTQVSGLPAQINLGFDLGESLDGLGFVEVSVANNDQNVAEKWDEYLSALTDVYGSPVHFGEIQPYEKPHVGAILSGLRGISRTAIFRQGDVRVDLEVTTGERTLPSRSEAERTALGLQNLAFLKFNVDREPYRYEVKIRYWLADDASMLALHRASENEAKNSETRARTRQGL